MQRYILKRIIIGVFTMFAIITLVFVLTRTLGEADPVAILLPPDATPEDQARLKEKFGLDKPVAEQYLIYLKNALRGDFGNSFRFNEPALGLVVSRIPATLQLAVSALLLGLSMGLVIGIVSAIRRDSVFDRFGRVLALIGMAVPQFVLALFLMLFFGVMLRWLPIAGRGGFTHFIMPVFSMSLVGLAAYTRLSRSSMIEVMNSEYIVMARIKGVPEPVIILIHALKNGCIPVITMLGLTFPHLITGNIVIETIFSWPGVGNLVMTSIFARDYPVVQVIVMLLSFMVVTINLLVDISYAYIDPRIRYR
ncbi:MAG: ABC transporter permease [Desulfobacteraceae bacterium]|nr:ABC transporter permease [Desulfobacteraceae bacterium]